MRQFIFPQKDASIYEEFPSRNTGLDEILEVGKSETGAYRVRSLINFPFPTGIPATAQYELKLYCANAVKMNRHQYVRVIMQSHVWEEGDGYYYQDRIQSVVGATWTDAASGSLWSVTGSVSFDPLSYYTPSFYSAFFGQVQPSTSIQYRPDVSGTFEPTPENKDFSIDVTQLVGQFISQSADPSFVIALTNDEELNHQIKTNIRFFSKDTHTIYRPVLIAKWDDQTFNTGTLTPLSATEIHVQPRSLQPVYHVGEIATVHLSVRAKYPTKTFATSSATYSGLSYLPSSSYFSVVDDFTNTEIIPFDNYSKISADANGSFVQFKIDAMYPLRYYRLRFKVVSATGRVDIIDDRNLFTVAL